VGRQSRDHHPNISATVLVAPQAAGFVGVNDRAERVPFGTRRVHHPRAIGAAAQDIGWCSRLRAVVAVLGRTVLTDLLAGAMIAVLSIH
jgi:hypothetical protein